MKRSIVLIAFLVTGGLLFSISWSQDKASQDKQMNAYIEMMRKDIRAERNTIVDQAMNLETGGKAKFWGIYDNSPVRERGSGTRGWPTP